MQVLNRAASSGALCSTSAPFPSLSLSSSLKFSPSPSPATTIFSKFHKKSSRFSIIAPKSGDTGSTDSPTTAVTKESPSASSSFYPKDDTVFVGQDGVPLEGVIQFDKPNPGSRLQKWGLIALLAGGDVLALLLFAAVGRFNHGFPVFDVETLRTTDPFIAGWFLIAYLVGGYSEDGQGMNGFSKAVIAAAKSWALGVPMGLGIRSFTTGHLPPTNFVLVTLGSTAVLLIGWRTLFSLILTGDRSKNKDTYRKGSPFELFELLTSLVRRW